jgi:hypothetical protein
VLPTFYGEIHALNNIQEAALLKGKERFMP